MAKGVRVNLSVSDEIDGLLSELAQLSGRSKASWVMEAIGYQIPNWHKQRKVMKFESDETLVNTVIVKGERDTAKGNRSWRHSDRIKAFVNEVSSKRSASPESAAKATDYAPPLSRQQRRALEREQRKKGITTGAQS